MSESRQIQRVQKGAAGGAIMTPQGPAVIQVIDMGGNGILPYGGAAAAPRKAGGINIFSAVGRRWWLVALVTLVIGGAGVFAGNNLIKPQYEAKVMVSYHDPSATDSSHGQVYDIVQTACNVLHSREIPLLAMQDPQMQALLPQLVQGKDIHDPEVELAILDYFKPTTVIDCDQQPGTGIVNLYADNANKEAAEKTANAFGTAFVQYCRNHIDAQIKDAVQSAEEQVAADESNLKAVQAQISKLRSQNNFDANMARSSATVQEISDLQKKEAEAKMDYMVAEATLKAAAGTSTNSLPPQQLIDSEKLRTDEEKMDGLLQIYDQELMTAENNLAAERTAGKTDQHPDVVRALQMVDLAKQHIAERKNEIAAVIDAKIKRHFDLQNQADLATAKKNLDKADGMIKMFDKQLADLGAEAKGLSFIKDQLDSLQQAKDLLVDRRKVHQGQLDDLTAAMNKSSRGTFNVEENAHNAELKEDKRIKVEAGGMVGGLFLGILLALLIDRFDKRLRDPRDVEPMLNAPLLGSIPKIQELKRAKGEQARNLIAEEFRIIRTQVLFGNPDLQYKLIAITSPSPGDGKTSLAVNLAISIAKAGRRVLLIDGDLRKPDIHRVFNIPDSPGFAELISASSEPSQVIRKSDIDGLDVLPAGTPIMRPSELLSRPEMTRILQALGELYDHVILDTAPLLPVSDTHVLVGMVDAVMVSFNASVEREIVALTQEILVRSHANVIGSVMNQVPYKQTASYQRGKSAYDSYYNSQRGAYRAASAGINDASVASISRKEVA